MDIKLKSTIKLNNNGSLYDQENGNSYVFNQVGSEILHMLQEDRDENFIIDNISQKYNVDRYMVISDFEDFIYMLNKFKLTL